METILNLSRGKSLGSGELITKRPVRSHKTSAYRLVPQAVAPRRVLGRFSGCAWVAEVADSCRFVAAPAVVDATIASGNAALGRSPSSFRDRPNRPLSHLSAFSPAHPGLLLNRALFPWLAGIAVSIKQIGYSIPLP